MFLKKITTKQSMLFDVETQPKVRSSGEGLQKNSINGYEVGGKVVLSLFILTPTWRTLYLPHVKAVGNELLKMSFSGTGKFNPRQVI